MVYTRAQVRDLIRQKCDLENTSAQVNSEINGHINDAAAYVHDFLIATLKEKYNVSTVTGTTSAGGAAYSIEAAGNFVCSNFYRPVAVRITFDGLSYPLASFSTQDRVYHTSGAPWGAGHLPEYAFELTAVDAARIRFDPPPDSAVSVTITYHPTAPTYSADSSPVAIPCVDLLIVEAAIRVKMKEERDANLLLSERAAIQKRIEDWVGELDLANPPQTLRLARYSSTIAGRDRLF